MLQSLILSSVAAAEEEGATLLGTPFHRPGLAPETVFELGPVHITNSMIQSALVVLFLTVAVFILSRGMKLIPGGRQNFLEAIVEALLGLVEGVAGRRVGRVILPLIGTLFIYILAANWSALLPGVGTILYDVGDHSVPVFRAPNADYNMTLVMALLVIVIVQIAGFSAHGVFGHLKEYLIKVGPIYLPNPLTIIDEIARVISLSVRLFANVFAGEVLVTVMLALSFVAVRAIFVPLSAPLPSVFLALEVFFGLIQAAVFALLSLIYISLAVGGHGDEHETARETRVTPVGGHEEGAPFIQERVTG